MDYNKTTYDRRLSAAITWLRFPLIVLIILLHCYSVVRLSGDRSLYFRTIYPLSLWAGETGVPGFFFISGYLFFLSKKSYGQRLRSRVRTLLVPYLLWNTALLALYLAAYAAGYPQDINYRSMADYGWADYLRLYWDRGSFDGGNFVPLLCPFWYVRNLLLMALVSPVLYYIIKNTREAFLAAVAAWWLLTYDNAFIPQTILFFSLGAYFPIAGTNPLAAAWRHRRAVLALWAVAAVADIATHTLWSTPVNLQVHRLALVMNIAALLLLADACCRRGVLCGRMWPEAAFVVFAVHYPIVVLLRKVCAARFAAASDLTHVGLYLLCVAVATALSLGVSLAMDRYTPRLKKLLAGNR